MSSARPASPHGRAMLSLPLPDSAALGLAELQQELGTSLALGILGKETLFRCATADLPCLFSVL